MINFLKMKRLQESVGNEMFELEMTSTSTLAKRKRKAFEHESQDYAMSEEPLWLTHNASIENRQKLLSLEIVKTTKA